SGAMTFGVLRTCQDLIGKWYLHRCGQGFGNYGCLIEAALLFSIGVKRNRQDTRSSIERRAPAQIRHERYESLGNARFSLQGNDRSAQCAFVQTTSSRGSI